MYKLIIVIILLYVLQQRDNYNNRFQKHYYSTPDTWRHPVYGRNEPTYIVISSSFVLLLVHYYLHCIYIKTNVIYYTRSVCTRVINDSDVAELI